MVEIRVEGIKNKDFYYNNLFYDYIFNFNKLSSHFNYDYRKVESFKQRLDILDKNYNHNLREKLAGILKNYNSRFNCSLKTIKNIDKLADPESAVIIGGQQPIIYSGPLFIIYKILSVIKLSSFIERELKIPVVPCFWNASDDSNAKEATSISLLDKEINRIKLPQKGNKRLSELHYSKKEILDFNAGIGAFLNDTDFKERITGLLQDQVDIMEDKVSLSGLFSHFILQLFADYGIVVVDPAIRELKELSVNIIRHDVNNFNHVGKTIRDAGRLLEKKGYHSQLDVKPADLNIFISQEGKRGKVQYDKNFKIGQREFNKDSLLGFLGENLEKISLNVVIRPIFQDSILPVLASICGPGEVSYFAQLKKVYSIYGVDMPIVYPRLSATLIEKKVKKALRKLGLSYGDISGEKQDILKDLIKEELNNKIEIAVNNLKSQIMDNIEDCEKDLSKSQIDFSSAFDRIKRNLKKEAKVLKGKLYSEHKKENSYIRNSMDKIYLNIFPNSGMQEREINILSYINKYDFKLIENIYYNLKDFDFGHKFIEIG